MDILNTGAALSLLLSEIKGGTLPGTILIEGKDEKSRKEAARLCAAALICEGENSPCLACDACKKVISGRHPDVSVISPSEKKVSVDDIRQVRLDAVTSPFEAECKVVILEQAQTLNVQSQNAILKILEEPPRNVYFILTSPSAKLLLSTVDSRCAKYSLGSLSTDDIYRSVCEFSGGSSENDKLRICSAILYLDEFVPNEKNMEHLKLSMDICDEFYKTSRFPFEKLPSKREDIEVLKLILKLLSIYALTLLKAKKGITQENGGIMGNTGLSEAMVRFPAKTAYNQYGFFCELYERLESNANIAAATAALRSGIYDL